MTGVLVLFGTIMAVGVIIALLDWLAAQGTTIRASPAGLNDPNARPAHFSRRSSLPPR